MEKTTNVKAEELNYDHYTTKKYDRDIKNSIPGYEELHETIRIIIQTLPEEIKVLELGIGTGLTTQLILRERPKAKVTAIDFSETMLEGAKDRLKKYNVEYIKGDYSEVKFDGHYDVVISVIGLHHQTHEGKKKLFEKIYDSLKEKGIFIYGDLMTYKDKDTSKEMDKKHYEFLEKNETDEKTLQEWKNHHKNLNLPAAVEDQEKWLREIGFSVEIKFKHLNTILMTAEK